MQISKVTNTESFGKFTFIKGIYAFPKITSKRQKILNSITKNFNVTADIGGVEVPRANMLYIREASVISFIPKHPEKAKMPKMVIKRTFNSELPDSERFSQLVETIKGGIEIFGLLK